MCLGYFMILFKHQEDAMNFLKRLFPQGKQQVASEPLSFLTWLRQNKDQYHVSERSELTFMWDGISFDVRPAEGKVMNVVINMINDDKITRLTKIMDLYAGYLHTEWPDKHVHDYVRWAHVSQQNLDALKTAK
jgi:hypothetical protein